MSALQVVIPDVVQEKAREVARRRHISLDDFLTLALVEKLSTAVADSYLEKRARRGNIKEARKILARVPDVPPEDFDRLE